MTTRNHRVRFGANNFLEDLTLVASSAMSGFPIANILDPQRSLVFRFNGNFTITLDVNDLIYINDGTNKTATLTPGSYSGPAAMATAVQTALNAVSSSWTCTYSTTTLKFTIARSAGTDTLRFTQTTEAAWDTLGFSTASDESAATAGTSDFAVIHTDEHITMDLGTAMSALEFHLITALSERFAVSENATIQLLGNASNVWTSPALTVTLSSDAGGIHQFLDDLDDTSYRFWRLRLVDRSNTVGSQGFKLGHIYLGDYVTTTNRNIANGFSKTKVDPSEKFRSDDGAEFHRLKTKYRRLESLQIGYLQEIADRQDIEDLFDLVGIHTPFYVSLDPLEQVSSGSELAGYFRFNAEPSLTQIKTSTYTFAFALSEAV